MTRSDFNRVFAAYRRANGPWVLLYLALMIGVVAACCSDSEGFDRLYQAHPVRLTLLLVPAFMLAHLPLLQICSRRRLRKHGLICPACDRAILSHARIAVASGCCALCGFRLFSEDDRPSARAPRDYLAGALERLMALPLGTPAELERWNAARLVVEETLAREYPWFEPEDVAWHFLHDADIRSRDRDYLEYQHRLVADYVGRLRLPVAW